MTKRTLVPCHSQLDVLSFDSLAGAVTVAQQSLNSRSTVATTVAQQSLQIYQSSVIRAIKGINLHKSSFVTNYKMSGNFAATVERLL